MASSRAYRLLHSVTKLLFVGPAARVASPCHQDGRRGPGFWAGLLALLVLLIGHPPAAAAEPGVLTLSDDTAELDGWLAVRLLRDPSGQLDAQAALARLAEFRAPTVPHANPGSQHGAVWLYLPLRVPAGHSGQWLLQVDYPSLQRVDAVQITGGRMGEPVAMGTLRLRASWPLPGRSPVLPLALAAGQQHAVLLRVETAGGFVTPIRLLRPVAHKLAEERFQAVQGLVMGLVLFLLLYSLTQWLVIRDPMYLDYALANLGLGLVFLVHFGLGPQHLWGDSLWFTRNAAPIAVLAGVIGIYRFIWRWLGGGDTHRHVLAALRIGAAVDVLVLLGFVSGLIEYRAALLMSSFLAPLPMLLALPSAWRRARAGSRQAHYMFMGWACYLAGAVTLTGLVQGWVPANVWTQHAFQVCSVAEMTFFLLVLGVRVRDMRVAAEVAQREHATLQALAHTDPLTGLLNRRGLDLALEAAVQGARPDCVTAVFLLDLDGFKSVNDRLGHDVGDALLVAVAARLKAMVRTGDAVARVGGDEFVVVVASLPGDEEAARLGQKLLDSIVTPIVAKGHACHVGATIGYALAPLDGSQAASLLKRADAAMYGGKQAGRHCVRRGGATVGLLGLPEVN